MTPLTIDAGTDLRNESPDALEPSASRLSPLRADAAGRRVRMISWLTLALGLLAIWAIISW